MKKKILLIANGEQPQPDLTDRLTEWADIIIAVDGGANHCVALKVAPDFIVGDLDSISESNRTRFQKTEIIYLPDQEMHDFDKALNFVLTLEPAEVRVLAGWGKRFDHILANLYVYLAKQHPFKLFFYDTAGVLSLLEEETTIPDAVGATISLFSFYPVHGLSIEGCKFKNQRMDYPQGFIGLSNIITANPAIIRIQKGSLLLYRLYEHD